jgi:hypothetical protein
VAIVKVGGRGGRRSTGKPVNVAVAVALARLTRCIVIAVQLY